MSYPHDLTDDHNDPCFMCKRIYRKHGCKGCQYKTCPKCGELAEECICFQFETENPEIFETAETSLFEQIAMATKPITPII